MAMTDSRAIFIFIIILFLLFFLIVLWVRDQYRASPTDDILKFS